MTVPNPRKIVSTGWAAETEVGRRLERQRMQAIGEEWDMMVVARVFL